ncbi:protein translocase subunit SecD [Marinicella sp. W31]|uniref:protein translocase subunit SecD n=1 Tax=Marinicella sp. W31 TaxID=3023713 RepID=UPI003756882F
MNRYPMWKNGLIIVAVLLGLLYALPNIYGQSPVVQINSESEAKPDQAYIDDISQRLKDQNIVFNSADIEGDTVIVRFDDLEQQSLAKDFLEDNLEETRVALNLKSNTPEWLSDLGGKPMTLGLDLRGGVYFLLEVDMKAAADNKKKQLRGDINSILVKEKIPKRKLNWSGNTLSMEFKTEELLDQAYEILRKDVDELAFSTQTSGTFVLQGTLTETTIDQFEEKALQQNLTTLRSRVNEVGVAEPIIQRQGQDRIVVQLPGIQDTTEAKNMLDAIATLEYRPTDMSNNAAEAARSGRIPAGSTLYYDRQGQPVLVKNRVIATGNQLIDASSAVDPESGSPMVNVRLNSIGASRMLDFTKANVGNLMAVVFKEQTPVGTNPDGSFIYETKEEVISNATIQGIFSNQFRTTGLDSPQEASDLALLLRSGALAAPVRIVRERTIGPSLGQENIDSGVMSVQIGFLLVMVFMLIYYRAFGVIANISLAINLILMTAFLSIFGATLTLPGIAGIVLTVGMAVDANVLIFERIKEEINAGSSIQNSIKSGYEKAFSTIADANVTTFIAAIVLFAFGTGPIKGFAVTLSIGILTSMFTAILLSRSIVNLIYGGKKRLKSIAI